MITDEAVLEEIAGFLHGYLKAGKISIHSFLSKMNVNIVQIKQLLIIRFLIKEETKVFVRSLPDYMKNFKTTTIAKPRLHNNEVRGSVNWSQTVLERLKTNPKDKTIYLTTENTRTYNMPENLVLKELLRILYQHLFIDEYIKTLENRNWFQDWQLLKKNVSYAYKKNIYIQRIDHHSLSERMIIKTMNHRSPLYRNAAKLLFDYRKFMNGQYTKEDLEAILRETFIAPENKDVLFELYWVVQFIKNNTEKSNLYILDGTQNLVASWENDKHIIKLFHDSTGSERFTVHRDEFASETSMVMKQKYRSFNVYQHLANQYFNKHVDDYVWQGRPDILVEVYDRKSKELIKLFIGEVKNTNDLRYAMQGLKELIDYVYFVKDRKGNYLFPKLQIQGFLCLRGVQFYNQMNSEPIKIVNVTKKHQLAFNDLMD